VAARIGQMDEPGERKIHDRPIPATGGVAIFWALAGPMIAGLAAVWVLPVDTWAGPLAGVAEHVDRIRDQTALAMGLIAALAVLHVTGLIDDRRNLGPYSKLVVQMVLAAALAAGLGVRMLDLLGPIGAICATVLWLVVVTNAFNFLDNMDGLSGGVAAICAAILLAIAVMSGQWLVAAVLALLVGALLGFLVFNYPPASIFMGDGGSLVVGFTLAVCAVRVTYHDPDVGSPWWAVFTPLVVLAVPLYDFASVTLIRLMQGKSPFKGDTQHFSHRLVRKGLSRPAAVKVIWACTVATGLGGILLGRVPAWGAALIVAQTAAILLVIALLERTRNTHDL
jgi:UDP-GlcNAc:undecaprenyl-phosphate GlcNAc-1-phosphate transferase